MISIASGYIISLIEKELIKHSPEIQEFIVKELTNLVQSLLNNLLSKSEQTGVNGNG